MKTVIKTLFILAVVISPALAQESIQIGHDHALPAPAAVAAPAPDAAEANDAFHSQRTLEMVRQAINDSDQIGLIRKRIMLRRLNRPAVAERVTDLVTSEALDSGAIVIMAANGEIQAEVDWDMILELIMELLPIIIKLISLFAWVGEHATYALMYLF